MLLLNNFVFNFQFNRHLQTQERPFVDFRYPHQHQQRIEAEDYSRALQVVYQLPTILMKSFVGVYAPKSDQTKVIKPKPYFLSVID
jgi:hypothetical protein